ncbi:response regulator [Candidatus Zixiibacteriota bacterium]
MADSLSPPVASAPVKPRVLDGKDHGMSKIRVFLADDHTIVRQGLKCLLKDEDDIEIVGEAENGEQLVKNAMKVKPDVILLDLSMPIMSGVQATQRLKKDLPKSKILILTRLTSEQYVYEALRFGASGFVVKTATVEDLVSAIKAVYRDETYISPAVTKKVVEGFVSNTPTTSPPAFSDQLTFRERQILKLIAEGWASAKIAEHLHISPRTVETHRTNIMQKLKLHKVADLVKYAIRRGLVHVEPFKLEDLDKKT